MVKIHGVVYLIVGLFIAIGSLIVNLQDKSYKFVLFLLIGLGMIVLGIIKLMGPKKKVHKPTTQQSQQQFNPQQQFVKYCSRCGAALQGFQQFCHNCGSKMFHRR